MYQTCKIVANLRNLAKFIEEFANNLKIGPRTSKLNPIKPQQILKSKKEQESALYEKLRFLKKNDLALVLAGALWRKLAKNQILEPFIVKFRQILTYF